MSIFQNNFLSVAGQKERVSNALQTVQAAVTLKGVSSNVKGTTGTVLSTLASNPYSTALTITTITTGTAAKLIKAAGTKTIIAGAGIGLAVIPAAITSPTVAQTTIKTLGSITPENIIKTSVGAGKLIENPSKDTAVSFVSENKGTLGVGGAALLLATGGKGIDALGKVYSGYQTSQQTETQKELLQEEKKQTKIAEKELKQNNLSSSPSKETNSSSIATTPKQETMPTTPLPTGSPNNPIITPSVGEEPKRSKTTKRKPIYRKVYKEELYRYPNANNRGVFKCSRVC